MALCACFAATCVGARGQAPPRVLRVRPAAGLARHRASSSPPSTVWVPSHLIHDGGPHSVRLPIRFGRVSRAVRRPPHVARRSRARAVSGRSLSLGLGLTPDGDAL